LICRPGSNGNRREERTLPLKYHLPKEVTPQFIVDSGELAVGYDSSKGLHYVHKEEGLVLKSKEVKEFTVEVKDVWVIPEAQITTLVTHTEKLVTLLSESDFKDSSAFLGQRILGLLDEIAETQNKKDLSIERHIGNYRRNLVKLDEAKKGLAKLEKLVIQSGGSPGLTLVDKGIGGKKDQLVTKGVEILAKSIFAGKAPSAATTWRIIWIVVGFLAVVSFLFFILWWTQIKTGADKKKEQAKKE